LIFLDAAVRAAVRAAVAAVACKPLISFNAAVLRRLCRETPYNPPMRSRGHLRVPRGRMKGRRDAAAPSIRAGLRNHSAPRNHITSTRFTTKGTTGLYTNPLLFFGLRAA
jgi:hypothetical protein